MPSSRERRERDAEASPFAFLRFWHTDEADVARELKEYDSLSPLQSARGRSALLAVALGVLSLVAGLARADVLGAVTGALIWLVIAAFTYRGALWAMVVGMLLFTFDRGASIVSGAFILLVLIFWALGMGLLYRAFTVERARRAIPRGDAPAG